MKCEEYQSLIEEFLDGELSHTVAENVGRHLDGCHGCARIAAELRSEQQLYSAYEPRIEVTPELWAGISARISDPGEVHEQGRLERLRSFFATAFAVPRFSGWATAGLVIIAIGATAVVMKYTQRQQQPVAPANGVAVIRVKPDTPPTVPSTSATTPAPEASETPASDRPKKRPQPSTAQRTMAVSPVQHASGPKTPNQLVKEAEQKYLVAIAMLSRDATRKRSQIDPATRAKLEQAIASIDRTIAGTRQAVRQHPGDPVAVQYMLAAYARKVDLLRDIAAQ